METSSFCLSIEVGCEALSCAWEGWWWWWWLLLLLDDPFQAHKTGISWERKRRRNEKKSCTQNCVLLGEERRSSRGKLARNSTCVKRERSKEKRGKPIQFPSVHSNRLESFRWNCFSKNPFVNWNGKKEWKKGMGIGALSSGQFIRGSTVMQAMFGCCCLKKKMNKERRFFSL